MMASSQKIASSVCIFLLCAGLTACASLPLPRVPLSLPSDTPAPSLPSPTPTVTPIPLAVSVNGEGVSLAEFANEVARYEASRAEAGHPVGREEAVQAVCAELTDQLLLAQGATQSGFLVDEATLQARLDALTAHLGGPEALLTWQDAHGYSAEEFRSALRRQIAAAWMRDQIARLVPLTVEQVHVQQILLFSESEAQAVLSRLDSGIPFAEVAREYDPLTGGELGWFPRGYLPEKAIEEAAFALQPGQYSRVVATGVGFHILYLVERDSARPLSADALLTLQRNAVQDWLFRQHAKSLILCTPDIIEEP